MELLDELQLRSERQQFGFTSQLAWMFGVQRDAREVVPDAQTHAPVHGMLGAESGCTMGLIRSGSQYWQDPRLGALS